MESVETFVTRVPAFPIYEGPSSESHAAGFRQLRSEYIHQGVFVGEDLGSSDVCYSKLELQGLSCHRMVAASAVRLLRWDNDLLLLIHLHTHQRLVETLNHLTGSQHHHQRMVVASRIVQSRALCFFFHRRVEDFSAGEFSDIVY